MPRMAVLGVSWGVGTALTQHTDSLCPRKVDKDFIRGLMYIRDNEATSEEFEAMSLPFTVPSASGQDIQLSSKYTHITLDNRAEYVRLAINYRCVVICPPVFQLTTRNWFVCVAAFFPQVKFNELGSSNC